MSDDKTISFVQALIVAIVAAVLTGFVVLEWMPKGSTQYVTTGSPAGTTFNTAKIAMINVSFASATSTSLLNGDASDRYIKSLEMACSGVGTSNVAFTGAGLASWRISASTSTSPASSSYVNANGNFVFVNTFLSTSSPIMVIASSTQQALLGGLASTTPWLAGSYLDIFTNATNTASCTVGVSYLAS